MHSVFYSRTFTVSNAGFKNLFVEWLNYLLLIAGAFLIALVVNAIVYSSMRQSRRKGLCLFAKDLDMEVLSSDEANVSIIAGEVHDRPSSIRLKNNKRSGTKISVYVECDSQLSFKVSKPNIDSAKVGEEKNPADTSVTQTAEFASLELNGLRIESTEPAKAFAIFREPETIHTILDLISETGASCIELANHKVVAVLKDAPNDELSPKKMSAVLERLDRFARLLEFVSVEESASEN